MRILNKKNPGLNKAETIAEIRRTKAILLIYLMVSIVFIVHLFNFVVLDLFTVFVCKYKEFPMQSDDTNDQIHKKECTSTIIIA